MDIIKTKKNVSIQNMLGCCNTILWSVGSYIILEPIRGTPRGLHTQDIIISYRRIGWGLGFVTFLFSSWNLFVVFV